MDLEAIWLLASLSSWQKWKKAVYNLVLLPRWGIRAIYLLFRKMNKYDAGFNQIAPDRPDLLFLSSWVATDQAMNIQSHILSQRPVHLSLVWHFWKWTAKIVLKQSSRISSPQSDLLFIHYSDSPFSMRASSTELGFIYVRQKHSLVTLVWHQFTQVGQIKTPMSLASDRMFGRFVSTSDYSRVTTPFQESSNEQNTWKQFTVYFIVFASSTCVWKY